MPGQFANGIVWGRAGDVPGLDDAAYILEQQS